MLLRIFCRILSFSRVMNLTDLLNHNIAFFSGFHFDLSSFSFFSPCKDSSKKLAHEPKPTTKLLPTKAEKAYRQISLSYQPPFIYSIVKQQFFYRHISI